MERISDIGKMAGNTSNVNFDIPNVENYSQNDILKYATIGLSVIALIKLLE